MNQLFDVPGLSPDGRNFGDPQQEAIAAGAGNTVAPLVDIGVIRATGADAADFLHNLLTNDIKGLGTAGARFAGLCTAKGRLLALLLVWREGEDLMLALPRDLLPMILKKLTMYVLRAKVKLADVSSERQLLGVSLAKPDGVPAPWNRLGALDRFACAEIEGSRAIGLGGGRAILATPTAAASSQWQALSGLAKPVGTDAWNWLEIRDAQPQVVAATQEAYVPQMLNLELPAVSAVSFTKGCYPGQEIVARTQYLGKVKRRMFRARMASHAAPGTDVFSPVAGEQHCGSIVRSAPSPAGGHECLVCVQIGAQESGEVRVGSPDGERLEFLDMPYPVKDDAPESA